jgi:hypothetical protein
MQAALEQLRAQAQHPLAVRSLALLALLLRSYEQALRTQIEL